MTITPQSIAEAIDGTYERGYDDGYLEREEEAEREFDMGYLSGREDAKNEAKLRIWHEMPDVEGWYWFRGNINVSYGPETISEYYNTIVYVERNDFGEYYIDHCGNWHTSVIDGEFRGPIPNPFEEADDEC
jgi:hypothetical protein